LFISWGKIETRGEGGVFVVKKIGRRIFRSYSKGYFIRVRGPHGWKIILAGSPEAGLSNGAKVEKERGWKRARALVEKSVS
jgi:hypothetical protein